MLGELVREDGDQNGLDAAENQRQIERRLNATMSIVAGGTKRRSREMGAKIEQRLTPWKTRVELPHGSGGDDHA